MSGPGTKRLRKFRRAQALAQRRARAEAQREGMQPVDCSVSMTGSCRGPTLDRDAGLFRAHVMSNHEGSEGRSGFTATGSRHRKDHPAKGDKAHVDPAEVKKYGADPNAKVIERMPAKQTSLGFGRAAIGDQHGNYKGDPAITMVTCVNKRCANEFDSKGPRACPYCGSHLHLLRDDHRHKDTDLPDTFH